MKKLIISFLFVILFCCITPKSVHATESIKDFHTKIIAHQNGDMTIKEIIQYDFGDTDRHGINRLIPTYTKVGTLYRISDISFTEIKRDNKDEQNDKKYNADEVQVKIGNPDKTISGVHTYEISYEVENGIGSNYEDHDEIYWNITGTEWNIPIEKASAEITTDFNAIPTDTICITGRFGSKDQFCKARINQNTINTETSQLLNPQEGLTIVAAYPVGTFPKSQLSKDPPLLGKDLKWMVIFYIIIWVLLNIVGFGLIVRWYLKHRHKNRFGKPTVNFNIPKDENGKIITPVEAGIIDNTKLEQNDVMATIFDLAIRKYLKIEQIKKGKTLGIFGGGKEYDLVRLKSGSEELNEFEETLVNKLFAEGDRVNLADIKNFYQTFSLLEDASFGILISRNFYTKNPKNQKAAFLIFGLLLFFSGNILIGGLLFYLSFKMNGRTEIGDKYDWQIDGLKIFLKNMKRYYDFQVKELYTVEKYIPYAMAFGFIDEFMDQIKDMYPNYSPSWYSGSDPFYSARYAMVSSMQSNFTTTAPSSSSGFSGGGFSGGGGGGGGGGSW